MEFYHFIVNFFREGGFFLYPLAAIFVVGVAISIERFKPTLRTMCHDKPRSHVVAMSE